MSGDWDTRRGDATRRSEPKAHVRKGNGARRLTIVIAAALTAVLAAGVVAYATDMFSAESTDAGPPPSAPASSAPSTDDKAVKEPTYPVDGVYQIQVEHSGMCLGTGPERGHEQRSILVQQPCEAAWPDLELVEIEDGRFTMTWKFADGWEMCLGVETPGTEAGANFSGYDCDTDERLVFQLKPQAGGLYQIRVPVGDLCMGVKERSAERGAALETTKCAKGQGSQLFEIIAA
ncbi:hypothetical protein AB0I28_16595 [Phytomonospora sp. NPDC050363]|uniref:RICIN domain-containing protein n=1 Tax=Phytomonospora sp. NPDC050363 TaxID=3155642 RepID=UPI0033FA8CAA